MRRLGRDGDGDEEEEEDVLGSPVGDGVAVRCCCFRKLLILAACWLAGEGTAVSLAGGAEETGRSWRGGGETPRRPAEAEEGEAVGAAITQKSKQRLPLVYWKSPSLTSHL